MSKVVAATILITPAVCAMNAIGLGYVRRIPRLVRALPTIQAYRAMAKVEKQHTLDTVSDIGLCGGMGLVSVGFTYGAYFALTSQAEFEAISNRH